MIPGNEIGINNLMNKLIYKGVEIITPKNNNIHVSGHPAEDELNLMYSWIKPKRAIPVHGEAVHINAHAEVAKKNGVSVSVFLPFSVQFGCRFARQIDGELLEYGVKFAQKMAPNGLRENRKLQINMSVFCYLCLRLP